MGSRTPNMVASKTWGSTVMVTWPSLVMVSLAGFVGLLDDNAFALGRLGPVLLEDAVRDPAEARAVEGLGQHAAAAPC